MNGLRNISINTTILLRTNQKPLDRFGRAVFVYCGNVLNYTKNIYNKTAWQYNKKEVRGYEANSFNFAFNMFDIFFMWL